MSLERNLEDILFQWEEQLTNLECFEREHRLQSAQAQRDSDFDLAVLDEQRADTLKAQSDVLRANINAVKAVLRGHKGNNGV